MGRHFFFLIFLVSLLTAGVCFQSEGVTTHTSTPPTRTQGNLIVASYNIKWLGDEPHDLGKLAKVIQHFDVCGILEVKKETAVEELTEKLEAETNEKWGYVFGVRTHRPRGSYHEAYGAVWRRDRVDLGNGVTSGIWDAAEDYRNDPYLVSFKRKEFDFTLLLVHTRWSDDLDGTREHEVKMLSEQIDWLRGFLKEKDIILAGDFNYSGTADAMLQMAAKADMTQVDPNPKTTFKANYSGYANAYDHMYLSSTDTTEYVADSCRAFDVTQYIYGNASVASMTSSKSELSDHLPVFAIFNVTGPDDD